MLLFRWGVNNAFPGCQHTIGIRVVSALILADRSYCYLPIVISMSGPRLCVATTLTTVNRVEETSGQPVFLCVNFPQSPLPVVLILFLDLYL